MFHHPKRRAPLITALLGSNFILATKSRTAVKSSPFDTIFDAQINSKTATFTEVYQDFKEQDLNDYDRIDEDTFNRIIWHAVKGVDRPYPEVSLK